MRHSGSVIKSMDSGAILPGLNPVPITYYIHEPQISHLKSRNNYIYLIWFVVGVNERVSESCSVMSDSL